MSKRRRGYPSETAVKRGVRIVHGDKLLEEKLGRNDLCPCGSGLRFKRCCLRTGCFRRREPRPLFPRVNFPPPLAPGKGAGGEGAQSLIDHTGAGVSRVANGPARSMERRKRRQLELPFPLAPAMDTSRTEDSVAGERVGVRGNSSTPHPGPLPKSQLSSMLKSCVGRGRMHRPHRRLGRPHDGPFAMPSDPATRLESKPLADS